MGLAPIILCAMDVPRVFRVLAPLSTMVWAIGIVWPGRIISEIDDLQSYIG